MSMVVSACVALAGFAGATGFQVASPPVEGQDYVTQCASDILSNNQSVLEIPWEIDKDRDVGYVGGLPVAVSAETEFKRGTLNTGRELEGFTPVIAIGSVVIRDTQQPAHPKSDHRYGAVGGKAIKHLTGVVNPTADLTVWQWQRNKWYGLQKELQYWIDRGATQKLIVVHSNGDVLYGGCTEDEIQAKYDAIIQNAGPAVKIVLAGEISPDPIDLGWKYELTNWTEPRMTAALANVSQAPSWIESYADCTNETFGACNSPPRYQFANGGVIIGPTTEIFDMFEELESYTGSENRFVNEYYLAHPDEVTIDYAGLLSLSLHNMKPGALHNLPIEVIAADNKAYIKNKVIDETVCFVHGNGNAFDKVKTLAEQLMTI